MLSKSSLSVRAQEWVRGCRFELVLVLLAAAAVGAGARQAVAQNFSDGFEGDSIDPYWVVYERSGTVSLTTDEFHSGNQSLECSTFNSGENKGLQIDHCFDEPTYGRVSIWVKDTGANVQSSNYLTLWLVNRKLSYTTDIGVFDYDLGDGRGGDVYYYRNWNDGSMNSIRSSIQRTNVWHQWEIESTASSFAIRVDGITLHSESEGIPFDCISFGMHAPSWRPAWIAYYDDFQFIGSDLDCTRVERLKVECKCGDLTASIKSALPEGTQLTLDNDGDRQVVTVNARGKAKGKWTDQSGVHTVSVAQCPELSRQTSCD